MRLLYPLLALLVVCAHGQLDEQPDQEETTVDAAAEVVEESATNATAEVVEESAINATAEAVEDGANVTIPAQPAAPGPNRRDFLKLGVGLGLGVAAGAVLNPERLMGYFGIGESKIFELQLAQVQGGAYAEIDCGERGGVIVLVDTGASISKLSFKAAARLGVKMRWGDDENRRASDRRTMTTLVSRSQPDLVVRMTVMGKNDKMPGGFDGIMGIDQLMRFAATEMDWVAGKLKLYTNPFDYAKEKGTMYTLPVQFRHSLEAVGSILPFTTATIGSGGSKFKVDGLIDTGSPVTVVGVKVADKAQMKQVDEYTLIAEASPFERYFNYKGPLMVAGVIRIGRRHPPPGARVSKGSLRLDYTLVGLDPLCDSGPGNASNSCGLHIHSGTSCSADALGHLHHLKADPWKAVTYTMELGEARGAGHITPGLTDEEVIGKTLIAHSYDGSRIACAPIHPAGPPDGLLPFESSAITLGNVAAGGGEGGAQCGVKHEGMVVYVGKTERMKILPWARESTQNGHIALIGLDMLRPHKHMHEGHGAHTGPNGAGRLVLDFKQSKVVLLAGKKA